jgi:predicted molibdopterin-dependent oxidoreductase YjgC
MGKFGNEFVNKPDRIKTPMIKKHGELVETSWEEALSIIASRLPDYKGDAFSLLVTPRATNEQAYTAGKFARSVMGTNNVDLSIDHRVELVEPLGRRLGNMAATGTVTELEDAGCVLVVNSNTTEEHNVAAIPIKKGHKKGNKLIVVDTREVELTRYADLWLRPFPGTENTLVGGMLKVILYEDLQDADFIASKTENLDELKASFAAYNLDGVAETTGVPAEKITAAARYFAGGSSAAIVYALDNIAAEARTPLTESLINLALVTGNVGVPNAGLFPLRPGANSQGALDVGCSPAYMPGQVAVEGAPGLTAPASLEGMVAGTVKAAMVVGDSPLFTAEAIHALSHTEFLVVQDLFLNDLAQSADVVLPMTSFAEDDGTVTNLDRWVQSRRAAIEAPGEARPSTYTFAELARSMGVSDFGGDDPTAILAEIANKVPAYAAINQESLEDESVQSPSPEIMKVALTTLPEEASRGAADNEFPFLFAPGRVLAMPGEEIEIIRSNGKNAIRREDALEMHPEDAASLGVTPGEIIEVATFTHRIRGMARTTGTLRGVIAATVLFGELATALDASGDCDPMLRVPGLHIMPVRVEKVPS